MNHGVDQTVDVLQAIATLIGAVRSVGDDGFQATDLLVLMADPAVREGLEAAVRGLNEIPDEMGDLTIDEVQVLVNEAFNIVKAIRG